MATSTDTSLIMQTQTDVSALSTQPSVLSAESENIRRLQREVYCIEKTLRAIGKKNSCSKEWITLKSKLDAANEELDAVLEDQQHLRSISSDGSQDLLSFSDEDQLLVVPPGSPKAHSTLILSHDLQSLEDLLEQTPKWSLPWFEIKSQIDAETKKCELQKKIEHEMVVHDKTGPITPHLQKESEIQKDDEEDKTRSTNPPKQNKMKEKDNHTVFPKDRELPATGVAKNESIFRRMSADDDAESISRPLRNLKTSPTYDSSACHANSHSNKLEVTVTVISVDGVIARRKEPKSKLPTQRTKNDASIGDTVTIVASFSQILSGKEFQTHLPSDPIEVETSVIPNQPFPQELVEWPNDGDELTLGGNHIGLSTYQYTREFQLEKQRDGKPYTKRFTPQTCPINISMSRRGKMLSLGKANLVITGEERGVSTSVVPISINHQHSKVKHMKKLLNGSKKSIPMVRIQGDNVQFGLKSDDAMLRVLISVRVGSGDQKVHMKYPAPTPAPIAYIEPSDNDYDHESVEDHQDESDKNIEEEMVTSNPDDTTTNVQLDKKIERMRACIKPFKETKSERILRYKGGETSDDGSSNSDDSLATSVLNDVHPRAASPHTTQLIDVNVSPMKDESSKKPAYKSNPGVDNLIQEVCTSLNFDIAEMWLHEGMSYHLINSHVQHLARNKSIYDELQAVYRGEGASERTHRLSMSMCKWAKKTGKVLWITAHHTPRLAQALKYSVSGVKLAVAVPICHEGTYATVIYFSMKGSIKEPFAPGVEDYLTKMSGKLVLMTK